MKITLIRHGESVANVGNFINDDPSKEVGLTDKGKLQTESLARRLLSEKFTHVYASQFLRAQQTANILLRQRNLPFNIDARLNERKTGMDGQPVQAFNDQVKLDALHFKTANGESFVEQMQRMRNFLDEIAARFPGGHILAVAHENPIIAALALTVEDAATVVFKHLENCGRLDLHWPEDLFDAQKKSI